MSKYTTGEIAKLCGVSVRTVQYYDSRELLKPSELSEGGRRLYSDEDVKRLKIICFLRDAGISIKSIGELLSEEEPESRISVLLAEQEEILREEMKERKEKLEIIAGIRRELKNTSDFSVASLGDIAYVTKRRKKMKKLHIMMVIMGLPINLVFLVTLFLWIVSGKWQPFFLLFFPALGAGFLIATYYFKHTAYICPKCHKVFKPKMKEALFADHTPTLRKLTCIYCGSRGFCVETFGKEKNNNE